ncbi:hypothetical protein PDIDSM_5525 [Penicillium digitatum]|nr:hypothetical protein PDIDSM_5525 [Penicillium digitatum]
MENARFFKRDFEENATSSNLCCTPFRSSLTTPRSYPLTLWSTSDLTGYIAESRGFIDRQLDNHGIYPPTSYHPGPLHAKYAIGHDTSRQSTLLRPKSVSNHPQSAAVKAVEKRPSP